MDGLSSTEPKVYSLLNLTGGTRGVGAIGTEQSYKGGSVTVGGSNSSTMRAVDRLPKAQMVDYPEYLPSQAGYKEGMSTKTLLA